MLKSGGINAFSTWQYQEWFALADEAMKRLDAPTLPPFASYWHGTGQWEDPAYCADTMTKLGYTDVKSVFCEFITGTHTVDGFTKLFGMMAGVLTAHWSPELKQAKGAMLLPELNKLMKERFGDKPVSFKMTSVLTTGRKA